MSYISYVIELEIYQLIENYRIALKEIVFLINCILFLIKTSIVLLKNSLSC